ncbi:MAG: hypothetical protein JNK76_12025 [Planctomycetales bacterium]|nr:hypothetical protein [Planctomycetales bacterium]MBN8625315.1 hypothetical protein [Planctomycetota bacterium]
MTRVLMACLMLVGVSPSLWAGELEIPVVENPGEFIEAQMKARWVEPVRLRWRIRYHPIAGMTSRSEWHIDGTHWWVRVYPNWVKLDEFDKSKQYEIDAVALSQNYGVIDFYVHRREEWKPDAAK